MVHGPSGVPSRPGDCDDLERLKRLQNASAYQRRVAAKGAAGGAQLVTRPRGPPVTEGVPASASRPPVNGVVNGGAPAGANAACSSEISPCRRIPLLRCR
jgi:hypothetical protein